MHHPLRLVVSSEPIVPTAAAVRAEQLWRAAWLCVSGRLESERTPRHTDSCNEGTVFSAWVSHLRHRLGDRRTPPVRALIIVASFGYGLRWLPSRELHPLLADHVRSLRDAGLADDEMVRRLALLVQPPLRV